MNSKGKYADLEVTGVTGVNMVTGVFAKDDTPFEQRELGSSPTVQITVPYKLQDDLVTDLKAKEIPFQLYPVQGRNATAVFVPDTEEVRDHLKNMGMTVTDRPSKTHEEITKAFMRGIDRNQAERN